MDQETASGEKSGDAPASTKPHRVLLVADEVFRGRDLAEELTSRLGAHELVQVFVITPAMARNPIDQELGNVDETLGAAGERLDKVIAELHGIGIEATGEVGDLDPLVAVGDGVREFGPDEIIVVMHVEGEPDQGEKGLAERLGTEFHQPVTTIRVRHPEADGGVPAVEEIDHAPAHERTEEEIIQETRNFPTLQPRDIAGIIFGVVGTIGLGIIALLMSAGNGPNHQDFGGKAAVVVLIAIGAFLLNVAHIVGLVFFQSVHYTGVWERFMARTSVIVTTVGLAVALVLWLT